MPDSPGERESSRVPPTSGTKPIVVSGMPIRVRSVTIRTEPCAEIPTPPPRTSPSMNATYGLGYSEISRFSRYSSAQKSGGRVAAVEHVPVDGHDVAAGAQPAVAGAADQHGGHGVVVGPERELLQHGGRHARGERVDGVGPVERDDAEAAAPFEQHLRGRGYPASASARHQLPSGITKLAPVRMPEGQRVVTVLVLV